MVHSGDQRLITALRQPGKRPAVRVFTHVKARINQRNNIVHQLFISRFRIQRIEGFTPLLRREVFRNRVRNIGFGIRHHHQHGLDFAFRQQVIHDLRNTALVDGRQSAVAKTVIEIEHRQRFAGTGIAWRRPHVDATLSVQRL